VRARLRAIGTLVIKADSLETRPNSSRLNAESSSRLRHGNKKYFLLEWKNPWTDPPAVGSIEKQSFNIVALTSFHSRKYFSFDPVDFRRKWVDWCIV